MIHGIIRDEFCLLAFLKCYELLENNILIALEYERFLCSVSSITGSCGHILLVHSLPVTYLLRTLWHIRPPQSSSIYSCLPQSLALRPMSSTLRLSSLFPLYASKLFLVVPFSSFPPVPMSLLCCCGCFYLVLECGQSSSIFAISLPHSVALYLHSRVILP